MHTVFLFVRGVMFLIDHDQTEIGIRQKQCRARADHDRHFAVGNRAPGAGAPARRQFRMPLRRPHTEPRREAVEELRGERDLRHQDEALPAAADHLGHGFEINFRLARTGDAVEQRGRVAAFRDRRFQCYGAGTLCSRQFGLDEIWIRLFGNRFGRQHDGLDRAFVDQPVDHTGADAGFTCRFALRVHHAVGKQFKHALARAGHACRRCTG
jgi:hypothetical protein